MKTMTTAAGYDCRVQLHVRSGQMRSYCRGVLTDRAPFEYRYLSGRLLLDLFLHDEAARPPWKITGGVSVWLTNLQASRADLDHANLHALAMRSERLVSDQTGSIEYTGAGLYVRDRLELRHHIFEPHMGWRGGAVTSYSGEVATEDGGRIFVALFGSASNVVGYRDPGGTGFYPSDMAGLYSMLDLAREPGDPEIDFESRWDDGHLSEDALAHNAIKFSAGGQPHHIGEHDFLARIFIDVDHHRYSDEFEGRVIMGAPLWVATPRPTQDPGRR